MVLVQELYPLIKHSVFSRCCRLLLEKDRTDRAGGYGRILLAQEIQRLIIEKLDCPCVGALSRVRDESDHVCLIGKKHDATQQTFRLGQQPDLDLADHTER